MYNNDSIDNGSKKFIYDSFFIILGSLIIAFATSQFLLPTQLSTGGFSGIATIIYYFVGIPMGTTVLLLNIPLFIFAYFKVGKAFLLRAMAGTIFLSFFLNLLERLPTLTDDKFLACIYGGLLTGLGTACILKASASTGGSDLIASLVKSFKPEIRTSNMIMIFDVIIVLINVILFKTIEIGLYSAIAIYLMGKVIDIVFEGTNFAKVMFIISNKYEEIAQRINEDMQRGTTGLYGKGMYTNEEKTILLCVTTRSEVATIRRIVNKVDDSAFIIIANAREVFGKGFKEDKIRMK